MVKVIGGGLAGCEAAWQLASRGVDVTLYEMRPEKGTFAHKTGDLAELVCSNSLRSSNIESAIGLLHEEMRNMDSIILYAADGASVPAGGALAVDREKFSTLIRERLEGSARVTIVNSEVTSIDETEKTIVATGPLTSDALSKEIERITGSKGDLFFFDAIAPIVYEDSINYDVAWLQSRYDKGGKDYINCPLNEEQYNLFIDALIDSDRSDFKEWEKDAVYFDGCLPIEVMAARGRETLRFGPMKPVGLNNPHMGGERPHAVVQLRRDNISGSLYNIVGFQTKIKYAAQAEVFRMIPGLENARFARLGGIHRNTFINSPKILDERLAVNGCKNIKFAGQITGVEGYVESAAIGMLAGLFFAAKDEVDLPPLNTALGSLLNHITKGANSDTFQPMNINYGLFPNLKVQNKKEKKSIYANNALEGIRAWKERFFAE